jgi:hypothetical protein
MGGVWEDRSVLEAASWRLASELARRHPKAVRVARTHPGGGQYDCLTLVDMDQGPGTIQLNRNGTIQVHQRFDGREPMWRPTEWDEYLRADPREFLHRLEVEAGLPSPSSVPLSTPRTLTLRVLAAIASTAVKSVDPIEITSGMIDTSGYGGGVNEADFEPFTMIPNDLFVPQMYDLDDEVGYRFWFVRRNGVPILAFDQHHGFVWTTHHKTTFELMALYDESRRHLLVTVLKLLRMVDQV